MTKIAILFVGLLGTPALAGAPLPQCQAPAVCPAYATGIGACALTGCSITGNVTIGGTLGVTGVSTLGAVIATTGTFSGTGAAVQATAGAIFSGVDRGFWSKNGGSLWNFGANGSDFLFSESGVGTPLRINATTGNTSIGGSVTASSVTALGNMESKGSTPYTLYRPTQWGTSNPGYIQAGVNSTAGAAGNYMSIQGGSGKGVAIIVGASTTAMLFDSTNTVITANGLFKPVQKTLSTIQGYTPTSAELGGITVCTDCASPYSICTATGTTIQGFRLGASGTTACQ